MSSPPTSLPSPPTSLSSPPIVVAIATYVTTSIFPPVAIDTPSIQPDVLPDSLAVVGGERAVLRSPTLELSLRPVPPTSGSFQQNSPTVAARTSPRPKGYISASFFSMYPLGFPFFRVFHAGWLFLADDD
jgi:hypothetical protein